MQIEVKLFALARDLAGRKSLEFDLPPPVTVADLRRAIAYSTPALAPLLAHMVLAVDQQYATDQTQLSEGCEVACIPPVSGG